jgi:hypothetical protein
VWQGMPVIVDSQKLAVALLFSLMLHLMLLASVTKGQPGLGKPWVTDYQPQRLQVQINTLAALQNSRLSADSLEAIRNTKDGLSESRINIEAEAINSESAPMGLPIDALIGPPYPPPEPAYLPISMLERPPQPLTELDTQFTQLEDEVVAGRMIFSLLIDERGHVDEVLVEYSSVGQAVISPVQARLHEMQFLPGMRAGISVKSRTRIEVNFSYAVIQ